MRLHIGWWGKCPRPAAWAAAKKFGCLELLATSRGLACHATCPRPSLQYLQRARMSLLRAEDEHVARWSRYTLSHSGYMKRARISSHSASEMALVFLWSRRPGLGLSHSNSARMSSEEGARRCECAEEEDEGGVASSSPSPPPPGGSR